MNEEKKQPSFQLGKLVLPNNIFYAPLAGCSDYPFRMMSAKYGPGLMFCEMVKMDALVRYDQNTFRMLDYDKKMHPIGAQLCGSKPELAGQAGRILEELGFNSIDFNCGCPVDKVTKDGSGSGMLKTPERIGEVLSNIVAAVNVPVTVKIRAGWDEDNIVVRNLTRIAEEAGAVAITVHGRTRKQGYTGPSNWDHIKAAVEEAKTIKVIGNGDIFEAEAADKMIAQTGCDGVLVARGTMGQPWIVEDILRMRNGQQPLNRGIAECRQALLEHFHYTLAHHNEMRVAIDMRRVGCWYIKKSTGTRQFRGLISKMKDAQEIRKLILEFPLEEGWGLGDSSSSQFEESC
jgi:tRNA-dihydrouridine synthase B